jgi:fumarate reductase flavoprotein subunit
MVKTKIIAALCAAGCLAAVQAAEQRLDADLVVVGAGAAGLPAAVQAAEKGAKVVVLEKNPFVGGGANAAEGLFGVETRWQRAKSIGLTREQMFKYTMEYSHFKADPALTHDYYWGSAENLDWLAAHGMKFDPIAMTPKDAPTWHVVGEYKGQVHGAAYVKLLYDAALKAGAQVMTSTPAQELIVENGRVVGVKAKDKDGNTVTVRSKATIIATGGFGNSPEKIKEWLGFDPEVFKASVQFNKTGDGIEMAWKVGADRTPMTLMMHTGVQGKGIEFPGAIYCMAWQPFNLWVNNSGHRFVDETEAFSFPNAGNAIASQEGHTAWAIWTDKTIDYAMSAGIDNGIGVIVPVGDKLPKLKDEIKTAIAAQNKTFFDAGSLDELAGKMGVPAEELRKTVDEYNGYAKTGFDLYMQKSRKYLRPIEGTTYYAIKLYPFHYTSLGGIRIDRGFHVVDAKSKPIPGLYAAGVDVGNLHGDTYGVWTSGHAFGWSSYSGRHAALQALEDIGGK